MIVKDEAHVIGRCLDSVRPFISSWVVVDTGSRDGTQDVVRKAFGSLPGELYERPWRDFATNRNEALELAAEKAEYALVIDADDTLASTPEFTLPRLSVDAYTLLVEDAGTSYWRTHLFRGRGGFRYVGVLHEVLVGPSSITSERLRGLTYRRGNDGARSNDPNKFRKDAAMLEAAMEREPNNARYAFYLAQSWRDAGELAKAMAAYQKRATMGGWEEEIWYSLYEFARLSACLGRPEDEVVAAFLRAYERRPSRAESLCQLAAYLRERGRPAAAYPFAKVACQTARPDDALFLDDSVYEWRARDELAVAAYWTDHHGEAIAEGQRLLSGRALPDSERARVKKNMDFPREKLRGAGDKGGR